MTIKFMSKKEFEEEQKIRAKILEKINRDANKELEKIHNEVNKMKQEEQIMGEEFDIDFDENIKKLNFELVKVKLNKDDEEGHYEIHIQDWTNDKAKTLVKLHMQDCFRIKAIIDGLAYDAQEDYLETILEKIQRLNK